MKGKREVSFDLLRAISMFMVIVVHVSNVYSRSYGVISDTSYIISLVFNTISRISVPIFLMISGALLLDREFDKKKYWNRIKRFLLLIIVWDAIYLYWEYIYSEIKYDSVFKLLIEPYRAYLWFLYTIIVLYIIQPLLKKILDKSNKVVKIILLIIWIIFSTVSIYNKIIASTFTIFSYIGYFILGKYLYDFIKEHVTKKYNVLEILTIIVCVTVSVILNYNSSVKHDAFYNLYFAYRTPFIMLSSFAFYAFVITNYQKKESSTIISLLSDVSLGVYLIHGIFLDIVMKNFTHYSITPLIGIPIYSIIIFACSVVSVYFLRKVKYIKEVF